VEQSINEVHTDSKAIQDYKDFLDIKGKNGWLVFERELNK